RPRSPRPRPGPTRSSRTSGPTAGSTSSSATACAAPPSWRRPTRRCGWRGRPPVRGAALALLAAGACAVAEPAPAPDLGAEDAEGPLDRYLIGEAAAYP